MVPERSGWSGIGDGWWREMDEERGRNARLPGASDPPSCLPQSADARRECRSGPTLENDGENEVDEEDCGREEPEDGREKSESTVDHEVGNGEALDVLEVLK